MTGHDEPLAAAAVRGGLTSFPRAGTAVVFGAGGGIGGALLAALRAADSFETVVAFSRSTSPSIDLLDEPVSSAPRRSRPTRASFVS